MMALIFEVLAGLNFIVSCWYWAKDNGDINHWLFFLLLSVIMYLNAERYEDNE